MGWAARVTKKRTCRQGCKLKVERTAKELRQHAIDAHKGIPAPEPLDTGHLRALLKYAFS